MYRYNLDNTVDGFYIAPAFMDKLVVHITKNFMKLPNIKVMREYFFPPNFILFLLAFVNAV